MSAQPTSSRAPYAQRETRTAVVGVDASLHARLALEHAAERVGTGGRLILVHVIPPTDEPFSQPLTTFAEDRRAVARRLLDRLLEDAGVPADGEVLEGGSPAAQVAELARREDADEIVVGSRGLGRFTAALGSVSHALLHEADRPVVVVPRAASDRPVRTREHGGCTVVVGYDGSPAAREALLYAGWRAGDDGQVVAVHAYEPAPDWLGTPEWQRVLLAHQARGRELLEALEHDPPSGVRLETSLLEGAPARAILAAAEARGADEVVVGSRGFGRLRGVLGSTAHALLHEAERPVVVIPAAAVAGGSA